ncbi:type IV conjugative transfer system lipoprotein TraV [Salmonella enterica]|nr:type IV conjugative transfer system lipoprotein TraV [Salmonella enterica]
MNKILPLIVTLAGAAALSGCAGTSGDFECNATTSDTCMTIEQANEKAKRLEESRTVKPDVAALPRLAEGNFRTVPAPVLLSPTAPAVTTAGHASTAVAPAVRHQPLAAAALSRDSVIDPRPLRLGEKTAALWIAPYIDTQDVYHQPTRVFFVVKPSAWGTPRVN